MSSHPPIVLATANPDKVVEIKALMTDIELLPRPTDVPDVVEDGDSLVANARLKARALMEATDQPAVADDTGLFVDALDGEPGIQAAYYAGPNVTYADNVNKLLAEMKDIPEAERTAHFLSVALLAYPDGREIVAEGRVDGTIAFEAKGDQGMGYDFVFVPVEGDGRTFAEYGLDFKAKISHRAHAFNNLRSQLEA